MTTEDRNPCADMGPGGECQSSLIQEGKAPTRISSHFRASDGKTFIPVPGYPPKCGVTNLPYMQRDCDGFRRKK